VALAQVNPARRAVIVGFARFQVFELLLFMYRGLLRFGGHRQRFSFSVWSPTITLAPADNQRIESAVGEKSLYHSLRGAEACPRVNERNRLLTTVTDAQYEVAAVNCWCETPRIDVHDDLPFFNVTLKHRQGKQGIFNPAPF